MRSRRKMKQNNNAKGCLALALVIIVGIYAFVNMNKSTPEEIEANLMEEKQDYAITFLQSEMEKYEIDFNRYTDLYTVANQGNDWIVTYSDEDNPRIKYIGEWDGNTDLIDVEDKYLLVNGTEVYNYLE